MSLAAAFGKLGDTPERDYGRKLRLFNDFAEPELRTAIASLGLKPGMRVLDAGCGTGEALGWLQAAVAPGGSAVGIDLAIQHLRGARAALASDTLLLQADLRKLPFANASFDAIWSVNTLHHLQDPLASVRALAALLRPGGQLVLGQSSLLPDMYFAWDARLERLTNEAVRSYYRDRYGVTERELAAVRAVLGLLRAGDLANVRARTLVIERIAPLDPATQAWLAEAIFRGTWGERLQPYLAAADYQELMALCDPEHRRFALLRPDFHFLQTFTLALGTA